MATVKYSDASGNIVNFTEIGGKLFPPFCASGRHVFYPEVLREIPNVELREDDIILCTYPKSGSHWLFEICQMLLKGETDISNGPKLNRLMLELNSSADLQQQLSPRVLFTHSRFKDIPKDFSKLKIKLIYVTRNPKDVAVSYFNHLINQKVDIEQYSGSFKDYLELFVTGKVYFGSWFDYVLEWEDIMIRNTDLHIHHVNYEQMQLNPTHEIGKLSNYLGLMRDDKFINQVAHLCSFKKMKERNGHYVVSDINKKPIFYRKGEVGDWRNWFTVAQDKWFDQIYQEKMIMSNLKFKYTLDL